MKSLRKIALPCARCPRFALMSLRHWAHSGRPCLSEEIAVKSVAVVGASGAVGAVMVRLLQERKFPVGAIKFLASERSAGKSVTFAGKEHTIEPLRPEAFEGVDIVLSSTPASISREYSPIAAKAGAVVVDNSSAWRMDPDVPLVVPEVNPRDVAKHKGIIANPNCSTIQMVVALKPLHDAFRITRVVEDQSHQTKRIPQSVHHSVTDHGARRHRAHPRARSRRQRRQGRDGPDARGKRQPDDGVAGGPADGERQRPIPPARTRLASHALHDRILRPHTGRHGGVQRTLDPPLEFDVRQREPPAGRHAVARMHAAHAS